MSREKLKADDPLELQGGGGMLPLSSLVVQILHRDPINTMSDHRRRHNNELRAGRNIFFAVHRQPYL